MFGFPGAVGRNGLGGASGASTLMGLFGNPADGLFIDLTDNSLIVKDSSTAANNYAGTALSKLTFTRASTATRFNASGLIESVASDVARIDYNPSPLALRGLLIEGARTNLLTYSEAFDNAAWAATELTVSPNAAVAPDGTTTADAIVPTTNNAGHFILQSASFTAAQSYVFSCFAKANGYRYLRLSLPSSAFTATERGACFDLIGGTVGATQANVTATIQSIGSGWYRCSIRATAAVTTSGTSGYTVNAVDDATAAAFAGNGTSSILVWGAQLELGAIPSSYIPTTSATVTRAAEVCKIATTLFPATATGPYTIFAKGIMPSANASDAARAIASLNNSGFNESRYLYRSSGGVMFMLNVTGGAANANAGNVSIPDLTLVKAAARFDLNNCNIAINGTLGTNDTTCALPSAPANLNIGNVGDAATNHWHGWIQQIAVVPVAYTDAQLQTVTS